MLPFAWRIAALLLPLWLNSAYSLQETEEREDDPGLNRFVSRPDITATKWNITTYHEDLIAPGYWFVAPYRILSQDTFGHGWVGAHIYDGRGDLIWSGKDMGSKGNVEDFRISNVRGELMMTMMDQKAGEGWIFDNHYEVREEHDFTHFNSHEFNFIDNGTKVLVVNSDRREASEEDSESIGFDGRCSVDFDFFQELDVTNDWEPLFVWESYGHIGLDESTLTDKAVNNRCGGGWDYLHLNSVDKTEAGDYLISGRHTNTIYKISKDDGRIMWRLGGTKSDFPVPGDLKFSRQHDIRVRGQNDTHLLVSIMDNAKGIDHAAPTHRFSRGLLLAIDESNMVVSLERHYDHPEMEDRYSPRRGNYQLLPNGNVFMGWSEGGAQSEHAPDGTLLFESIFAVKWLGTYRHYKFPFVGEPTTPPDVYAEAVTFANKTTATVVHVSWNGATEVATWNLYKADKKGDTIALVAATDRRGFETALVYDGLAKHVLVKALDKNGEVLGTSDVFKTIVSQNVTSDAISNADNWLSQETASGSGLMSGVESTTATPLVSFFGGFICSIVLLLVGWFVRARGILRFRGLGRYQRGWHSKGNRSAFTPFSEVDDDDDEESALPLRTNGNYKETLDERL